MSKTIQADIYVKCWGKVEVLFSNYCQKHHLCFFCINTYWSCRQLSRVACTHWYGIKPSDRQISCRQKSMRVRAPPYPAEATSLWCSSSRGTEGRRGLQATNLLGCLCPLAPCSRVGPGGFWCMKRNLDSDLYAFEDDGLHCAFWNLFECNKSWNFTLCCRYRKKTRAATG